MTREEINAAFERRLLVTVNKNPSNAEGIKGKTYKIMSITCFYDTKLKQFCYAAGISEANSNRTVYNIDISLIEPLPGNETIVKQFILQNEVKG